ncbi:hypothetical protein E3N88_13552 [Mikania micrantha]|uniref:non-specific serine/threonine protein kinase n=1 Tax=Mikania micrantha TaxID=192012 RepID=A0A5N6P939_9ASTR|nr:hypothetical protein E3N88_13552 [Mikania micrantha]
MGATLPRLVRLQLSDNQLTGILPLSISNCSRLGFIEMSENQFNGKLMIDFAKLKDIYQITLVGNPFGSGEADEMKFIDSLKNCSKLKILDLGYCRFQGMLPTTIGGNQFTGEIPFTIGKLQNLGVLSMYRNQFTDDRVNEVIDDDFLNYHQADNSDCDLKYHQDDEIALRSKTPNTKKLEECMASILKIGVLCSLDSPTQRMSIKNVVHELKRTIDTLQNV